MGKIRNFFGTVAEQIWLPFESFPTWSGLRSTWREWSFGLKFWSTEHPLEEGTTINYELARRLYRNRGDNALGASFAAPIVDLQVDFIGAPIAATGNESLDDFLNECLSTYWDTEIQEMMRNSLRDSVSYIMLRVPDILDPLMTMEEKEHARLEILPPDIVELELNARNKNIIERALIRRKMVFITDSGSVTAGRDPRAEEHDVLEIVTRESYTFFDQTENKTLDSMAAPNNLGFVPIAKAYNNYDAALQGGQSEYEGVYTLFQAFHEVMTQGLQAHKYHSTPKVKLKLNDVIPFLRNNYPDALDESGNIRQGASISWTGREIVFLTGDEDMGFVEAKSVLGDTKALLELIIDCICIASRTPEWAFMRVDSGSANSDRNAQTVPFVKKIDRKRRMFARPIQELLKMAIIASGQNDGIPIRAQIEWEIVREDDRFVHWQAFQQLIMGLEVAHQAGEISDQTYMKMIRQFLPLMQATTPEKAAIKSETPDVQPGLGANMPLPAIPVRTGSQGRNE